MRYQRKVLNNNSKNWGIGHKINKIISEFGFTEGRKNM